MRNQRIINRQTAPTTNRAMMRSKNGKDGILIKCLLRWYSDKDFTKTCLQIDYPIGIHYLGF